MVIPHVQDRCIAVINAMIRKLISDALSFYEL